jgi:anti-sigma factor RsiW
MNCAQCEERMSEYLEGALDLSTRLTMEEHVRGCRTCSELLAGVAEVLQGTRHFPRHEAPPWLAARVLANTPHVERETWHDTLVSIWRWIIAPRTAMAIFTSVVVLGWIGSILGYSPDLRVVVRHPVAIYDQAGELAARTYDRAVRSFYRAPLVTQIRSQLDQLWEIS